MIDKKVNVKKEDLTDVPQCEKCRLLLGQSTHINVASVMYTISPDPYRDHYCDKLPDDQKKYIDYHYIFARKMCEKKGYTIYGTSVHYEFNKKGELHIHGIMLIDEKYKGYDKTLITLSKLYNRELGRQGLNSMISSKFEWIKDQDELLKYVNKENVYESQHWLKPKEINITICLKDQGHGL